MTDLIHRLRVWVKAKRPTEHEWNLCCVDIHEAADALEQHQQALDLLSRWLWHYPSNRRLAKESRAYLLSEYRKMALVKLEQEE